jgi:membrane protein DedA with SNARE-associated domain
VILLLNPLAIITIFVCIIINLTYGLVVREEIAIYSNNVSPFNEWRWLSPIALFSSSLSSSSQPSSSSPSSSSSSFVTEIVDTVTSLVSAYGYSGVFIAMLVETVFPPIPSEAILPLAGYAVFKNDGSFLDAVAVGVIGALGSTVGSIAIYMVVRKIGRYAVIKSGKYFFINSEKMTKIEEWFEKHGSKAVFLARMVPGMRELISIPAGLSKMNFAKYCIFTFAGSFLWSVTLTLIGYTFGEAWQSAVAGYTQVLTYVAILSTIGIIIIIVGYQVYRRRKRVAERRKY